jgi:hypothetical protein
VCCGSPGSRPPPVSAPQSKSATPPAPRKPTTYELVERKKALQDLIKGFKTETDFDYHTPDEAKRLRELNAELEHVNTLLAGVDPRPQVDSSRPNKSESLLAQMRSAIE